MSRFTKKQTIGFALFILLMLCALFFLYQRWESNHIVETSQQYFAQINEKMGAMQPSDTLRVEKIITLSQKTGSISDNDLAWLLDFLKKNNKPGLSQHLARSSTLGSIEGLKSVTPSQEEQIYQAVLPILMDNPTYNDELDKIRASAVMGTLRDKRAIPYLVPLLTAHDLDSDGQLHIHVQVALNAIGYQPN